MVSRGFQTLTRLWLGKHPMDVLFLTQTTDLRVSTNTYFSKLILIKSLVYAEV